MSRDLAAALSGAAFPSVPFTGSSLVNSSHGIGPLRRLIATAIHVSNTHLRFDRELSKRLGGEAFLPSADFEMDTIMRRSSDLLSAAELNYEQADDDGPTHGPAISAPTHRT